MIKCAKKSYFQTNKDLNIHKFGSWFLLYFYTIAHSKRRTRRVGVFDCALATVTLSLINPPLLYSAIQQSWIAIYKSAV